MATTPTSPTDWGELAETGLGLLKALAATVTPTAEQKAVANYYEALTGALGRPVAVFGVEIDKTTKTKTLIVIGSPDGASHYRVGNFRPGGKREEGKFSPSRITLRNVDLTKTPVTVELYDDKKVLLARGFIR